MDRSFVLFGSQMTDAQLAALARSWRNAYDGPTPWLNSPPVRVEDLSADGTELLAPSYFEYNATKSPRVSVKREIAGTATLTTHRSAVTRA